MTPSAAYGEPTPVGEEADARDAVAIDELTGQFARMGVETRLAALLAERAFAHARAVIGNEADSPHALRLVGKMLDHVARLDCVSPLDVLTVAASLDCDEVVSLRDVARRAGVSVEAVSRRVARFRKRFGLPPTRFSGRVQVARQVPENSRVLPEVSKQIP